MQTKYPYNIFHYTIFLTVMMVIFCIPAWMQCKHTETALTVIQEPTCIDTGIEQTACIKCKEVLDTKDIPATGHDFSSWILTTNPTAEAHGEETRQCKTCDLEEKQEYICPHTDKIERVVLEPLCSEYGVTENTCNFCSAMFYTQIPKAPHEKTKSVIELEPTCHTTGIENLVCVKCEGIDQVVILETTEHPYGEWEFSKYATPFESGHRSHTCTVCEHSESEEYTVELQENHIYIPSAGINAKFRISTFTQEAVDSNDIVYTKRAYSATDDDNPFVLGHWYGSLRPMYKTPVGAYIYINIENRIDVYEVINSEYAVETANTYHIGQETGVNVFDAYGSDLLSSYAVFGVNHRGKDLWPDQNDGRTLHMYTCHYGKDKPGWDPKHGSKGRWIILANLIDSVALEPAE